MINATLKMYEGRRGYFPVSIDCTKDTYFTTSAEDLAAASEYVQQNRQKALYATVATFTEKARTQAAILELAAHFIDIDSHIVQPTEKELQGLKNMLLDHMKAGALPYGDIKDSGRGLGILIKLKPGQTDIAKYATTQEALQIKIDEIIGNYNALFGTEKMTLDKAVKNANRLTRITGSYNAKAGKYCANLYTTAKEYTQAELLQKYGLYILNKKNEKIELQPLATATPAEVLNATQEQRKAFKGYKAYTAETLRQARLKDLLALIQKRNRAHVCTGYRENLIYIACYLLREKGYTLEDMAADALQINGLFAEPLSASDTLKHCRYAAQGPQRYFTNRSIIDLLNISEDERKDFLTIITPAESRKRRNRRYYDNSSAYRLVKAANQNGREERKKRARELLAAGHSHTDAARLLNVSRMTIYRWEKV